MTFEENLDRRIMLVREILGTAFHIEEKIGDTINYLIILESMIKDRRFPCISREDWSEAEEEVEE